MARWPSPLEHTPAAPQEALTAAPLLIMGLATTALAALALGAFRRRDVPTT